MRELTTELCELALKWTSDKVLFYTEFYHSLLKDNRDAKKILELGIGYPCDYMFDSMMRMGLKENSYKTGASIYMWEEYFPKAEIYALDNNREILINEGRIKSFYCDQADEATYPLKELGTGFDLIIDDGSHIKEHQLIAMKMLVPLLTSTGVYIMEDIGYLVHSEREQLLEQIPYVSELKEFRKDSGEAAVIAIRNQRNG